MYVVVSLEYLEKFILPIEEKSGRYIYDTLVYAKTLAAVCCLLRLFLVYAITLMLIFGLCNYSMIHWLMLFLI
jgi:hypothetical protein